jgi:hypothetical protein
VKRDRQSDVPFKGDVICQDYKDSVTDKRKSVENWWNNNDRRKQKYSEGKTCPSVILSTINPILTAENQSIRRKTCASII